MISAPQRLGTFKRAVLSPTTVSAALTQMHGAGNGARSPTSSYLSSRWDVTPEALCPMMLLVQIEPNATTWRAISLGIAPLRPTLGESVGN